MKKLFCFLSVALAGVICASAAKPTVQLSTDLVPKDSKAIMYTKVEDEATKQARKNGKRQVSADDYVGYWKWEGHNWLNGVVFPNEGVMSITKNPTDPSKVVIMGFEGMSTDMGRGLQGSIDADGVLLIPKQPVTFEGDIYYDYYGLCYFQPYTVANVPDEPGYVRAVESDRDFWFVLASTEEGELVITSRLQQPDDITDAEWPNYWMNGATVPEAGGGYYWLCGGIDGLVLQLFEFNPSEWSYVGDAQFYDAWFNPILNQPVDEYPVPLYQNKLNDNRYLLFDPYGPDTPFGMGDQPFNESDAEGYIIFDITNPNCIVFEPYVYSAAVDMGMEEADIENFYNYNLEGYYYLVQGTPLDDIEANLLDRGKDVSYLDDDTVWIFNAGFDMLPQGTPGQFYSWTDADMSGYIVLPEGYDDPNNGVEGITDESNAAPVYFNLQGVRVNNPEKGQLLIVKKGAKTSKQIIR